LNEKIQATFEDLNLNIKMIPPDEVRKLALPNYISDKGAIIEWHKVINDNAFRDKIESLSLRYIILIEPKLRSVESWKSDSNADWNYFAFYRSHKHLKSLLAKVIDLSESRQVAEVHSDQADEARYGIGGIGGFTGYGPGAIVFPIISPTKDHFDLACKELAENISALFTIPSFKKIKSVKSAVKKGNGDIKICAELEDSRGLGSSEFYIINLPLSSLKDGVADLETLGFRKEGCKGNIVYTAYRYGSKNYCTDDIIYYLFPLDKTQKGCSKISYESLTMESVLPIEKLIVDLEKISQLSSLLNSRNKEHPYLERVYEINFVSDEEGIVIEKGDDDTKEELGKSPQEIRLIYCPPQIAQEATNQPIFTMGFAGGYDREDQDADF